MKEFLKKVEEKTVVVNGIEMIPLSVLRHELEKHSLDNVKTSLEHIQTDVKDILKTLQTTSKQILND